MPDPARPMRRAVNVGFLVAAACGVASFYLIHWFRAAHVDRADLVMQGLVTLCGIPAGALSGTIGFLAGRWWWRRGLRRRTIDR